MSDAVEDMLWQEIEVGDWVLHPYGSQNPRVKYAVVTSLAPFRIVSYTANINHYHRLGPVDVDEIAWTRGSPSTLTRTHVLLKLDPAAVPATLLKAHEESASKNTAVII